jgi:hypothetical protein
MTWNTQAQMSYGSASPDQLAKARNGGDCPLHEGYRCTVIAVSYAGLINRKVTSANCQMPLWPLTPGIHNPYYLDSKGHAVRLITDYPYEAEPLQPDTFRSIAGEMRLSTAGAIQAATKLITGHTR